MNPNIIKNVALVVAEIVLLEVKDIFGDRHTKKVIKEAMAEYDQEKQERAE